MLRELSLKASEKQIERYGDCFQVCHGLHRDKPVLGFYHASAETDTES